MIIKSQILSDSVTRPGSHIRIAKRRRTCSVPPLRWACSSTHVSTLGQRSSAPRAKRRVWSGCKRKGTGPGAAWPHLRRRSWKRHLTDRLRHLKSSKGATCKRPLTFLLNLPFFPAAQRQVLLRCGFKRRRLLLFAAKVFALKVSFCFIQ